MDHMNSTTPHKKSSKRKKEKKKRGIYKGVRIRGIGGMVVHVTHVTREKRRFWNGRISKKEAA